MSDRIELIVTVKAYPAVGKTNGESVCVAGIRTDTETPEHVRLFPVAFRDLEREGQFAKYQALAVEAERNHRDVRPESYRPRIQTLELGRTLSTRHGWSERRELIAPLEVGSMCDVLRRQQLDGTSLAVFRPHRVDDFVVEHTGDWSDAQKLQVEQPTLFDPEKKALEKIPYRFSYRYSCGGRCRGHEQSIIDWEIGEAYRKWRRRGTDASLEKLRAKWLDELCGPTRDTFFFVGNMHQHPRSFLMLSVSGRRRGPTASSRGGRPRRAVAARRSPRR